MLNIDIMLEVWKDIPGFNNWYQVSNLGRIRNKDKYVSGRYKNCPRLLKQKILKFRRNNKGYVIVDLYNNRRKITCLVSRIVASVFIENPNPYKYTQVNHKDGNLLNNSVSNLEWIDDSGNMKHSYDVLHHSRICKKVPVTLSNPITGEILYEFKSIADASRFIKRDPSVIRRLLESDLNNIKYGYRWKKSSTTIESDEYYNINIH